MPHSEPPQSAAVPRRVHWRRFLQYRLRTLLIVMVVVFVAMGVWSNSARRQRAAVESLKKVCALVMYDFEEHKLASPPHRPAWLVELLGVDYFANVTVAGSTDFYPSLELTNAHLKQLEGLPSLRVLGLQQTQVTDAGLEQLRSLTALEHINLSATQATDTGLDHLRGLKALKELYIGGSKVTEAGVARLRQALPNCEIHH